MDDEALSPELRRLIGGALPSVEHVDVLLQLSGSAAVTAVQMVRKTRLAFAIVAGVLEDLTRAGLVVEHDDGYRLTDEPTLRVGVDHLVAAYDARPASVLFAVYSRTPVTRSVGELLRGQPRG